MPLTDLTQTSFAFKRLLGKANTDNAKSPSNELIPVLVTSPSTAIWTSEVDSDVNVSVASGVVSQITANLVLDNTSNGHAYRAVWAANANIPYLAGSVAVVAGDPIIGLVAPKFGLGYESVPKTGAAATISAGDPRDWIFDYDSGVFFQQDNVGDVPATIDVTVYLGYTLKNDPNVGGSSSNASKEPVIDILGDETTIISPSTGDRYLVASTGLVGDFVGNEDKFATYTVNGWDFVDPANGDMVKVLATDKDTYIYHFVGTYGSGGTWIRQILQDIRLGIATYSANEYAVNLVPAIDDYLQDQIFFMTVDVTNASAASTVNINNLGSKQIKKLNASNSAYENIGLNDLIPGIVYMWQYDGTDFVVGLTTLASAVCGTPTVGDYTNGLFPLTPTTPQADANQKFNDFLALMAPPIPPPLDNTSITSVGSSTAKLVGDDVNAIAGYTAAVNAQAAVIGSVSTDGTFTKSGGRLGVIKVNANITGVIADSVIASVYGGGSEAYPENSFPNADLGSLELRINGVSVDTIDLTATTNAVDNTSANTVTGLSVSAEASVQFENGNAVDNFRYRTGVWRINAGDAALHNGYNYIEVAHVGVSGSTFVTDIADLYIDADVVALSGGINIGNFTGGTERKISGVSYYTSGSFASTVSVDKCYTNTYYSGTDGLSYSSPEISSPNSAYPISGGDPLLVHASTPTLTIKSGLNIVQPVGTTSVTLTAKHNHKASLVNTAAQQPALLIQGVADASGNLYEDFNGEQYRMPSGLNFASQPTGIGMWDVDKSIAATDANAGYSDGLQITEGKLIYAGKGSVSNYSTLDNSPSFNDGGVGGAARDYSGETNVRSYVRWFKQLSPSAANFILLINGGGAINLVPLGTTLTGNNAHVEFRAPGETGWMDGYLDFINGNVADGDGARYSTNGSGGINSNLGLTIGTANTANTGGYVMVRITTGSTFTESITSITLQYL